MGNACFRNTSEWTWSDLSRVSNPSHIPAHPYLGKRVAARVLRVVDGDTLEVLFGWERTTYRQKVRILGLDTPECKSSNAEERKAALLAKTQMERLVATTQNNVWLDIAAHNDKYGRLLARVVLPDAASTSVAEWMLSHQYGYRYEGKLKKQEWGTYPFCFLSSL